MEKRRRGRRRKVKYWFSMISKVSLYVLCMTLTVCCGELVEQVSCGRFPYTQVLTTPHSQLPGDIIMWNN